MPSRTSVSFSESTTAYVSPAPMPSMATTTPMRKIAPLRTRLWCLRSRSTALRPEASSVWSISPSPSRSNCRAGGTAS